MALLFGEIVQTIIALSTVGFVVFLAMPALLSYAWEKTKETTSEERLSDYRVRFAFAVARPRYFFCFLGLSVAYLTTGLMILLFIVFSLDFLVMYAVYLETINVGVSIGAIICLLFGTHFASTSEIKNEWETSSPQSLVKKIDTLEQKISELGTQNEDKEIVSKFFEYLQNSDDSKTLSKTKGKTKTKT